MIILDQIPLMGVYTGMVIIVLLAAEIGFRIGMWLQRRDSSSGGASLTGAVVGGMLGLMAFLLAFSIGIVIGQHNSIKAMVVEDANVIGTAYMRAGFLSEPNRTATRDLLRDYVEVRLTPQSDHALLESVQARSEEIHLQLWSIVEDNVQAGEDSAIMALFTDSINEVIGIHSLRLATAELRLPRLIGTVLLAATILSFLLVGAASSSDGNRDLLAILIFALAFIAVPVIIIDVDRPQQGLLNVSQQSLSDLLQQMMK